MREPPPELAGRELVARHRHPGRAQPLHVLGVLLGREPLREDGEQVLGAVELGEPLEDPQRVLAPAPHVRDVREVDLLRLGAERAQVSDLAPVEEAVPVHDRPDLRVVVVARPAVRLEVDVAPGERLRVADLAPVVRVDREADAVCLVAADERLAAAARKPVREAHLRPHAGHGRQPAHVQARRLLEPEEVVLLVADRPPDSRRRVEGDAGQAAAPR